MALPISGGLNGVQLMWFKRSAKTELGSKSYNAKVKQDTIVIQIDPKCRHFGTEKKSKHNQTVEFNKFNKLPWILPII